MHLIRMPLEGALHREASGWAQLGADPGGGGGEDPEPGEAGGIIYPIRSANTWESPRRSLKAGERDLWNTDA